MLRNFAFCCLVLAAMESVAFAQAARHFTFDYAFTVKNLPAGEKVRVWFPAAHSDQFQEVRVISAKGDLPLKKTHESRFGNEIYFAEVSKSNAGELRFEVIYDVTRHERVTFGLSRPRPRRSLVRTRTSSRAGWTLTGFGVLLAEPPPPFGAV